MAEFLGAGLHETHAYSDGCIEADSLCRHVVIEGAEVVKSGPGPDGPGCHGPERAGLEHGTWRLLH